MEDTIVYTMTGQENKEFISKNITWSQLRQAPVGTTFSVGDEDSQSSEKITVYASSGKKRGGVGVLIEETSPFIQGGKSLAAAWISDEEPVRSQELSVNRTVFDGPEPEWLLTSTPAFELQAYDTCQKKIDMLNKAAEPEMQEKILDKIHADYLKQWALGDQSKTAIPIMFKDGPEDPKDIPEGIPLRSIRRQIMVTNIPPVNRLQEMMRIKKISCRDLILDAVTGGDELMNDKGIQLSSETADRIYNWLKENAGAGRTLDLNKEEDARQVVTALAPEIEKDLSRWNLEKFSQAREYLREKYLKPFLEKAEKLKGKYEKEQAQIDSALEAENEIPKMKRMAYEIRCQAFTRNVEKDLTRYIKPTETYDLRKDRDDDYIVPKTFFQKIEKAGLEADPDWKHKVYSKVTVQEEIGDETRYRVSMPKGLDPVLTLCGSEEGVDALKQLLRREYLRQIQLEAEQFNPENNRKRAEKLLDTVETIRREEIVCHELSSPAVEHGVELRAYFQKDLKLLREQRDQLYADLQVSPGLKNEKVFEKIRKTISKLPYDNEREAEKIEKSIRFNSFTRQAEAPARLLENLADQYGIQTAAIIPGYEQKGTKIQWLVPTGDTPLKSLGINRQELGHQLNQGKREKVLNEIQQAIEHPQPEKTRKTYYSRNRGQER